MRPTILVSLWLIAAIGVAGSAKSDGEAPRYYESPFVKAQKVIFEGQLGPGEEKSVSIESAVPKDVRIVTDRGADLSRQNDKDGKSEIGLSSLDHQKEYVRTTNGAGTRFTPENGLIRLSVRNDSELGLRVAVCLIDE